MSRAQPSFRVLTDMANSRIIVMLIVWVGVVISTVASPISAEIIFSDDFESGTLDGTWKPARCSEDAIKPSSDRARVGTRSLKTSIRSTSDITRSGKSRAELSFRGSTLLGDERWYG